jgi:phenylacetate-CoA ligase
MFVDPAQIAAVARRHPDIARTRLVVGRDGDRDVMVLHVEMSSDAAPDLAAIEASLREITKLGGAVRLAASGSLANDGKVISDERDYSA